MMPRQRTLLLVVFLFASFSTAWADLRSDTIGQFTALHHDGAQERFPDEMNSLEATLALADMYYRLNDSRNAERYYQLAIQKAAVIRQRLQDPGQQEPPRPADQPPAVIEPAPPAVQPPPAIPQTAGSTEEKQPLPDEGRELPETFQSARLVGHAGSYTAVKGDTLRLVAAKLGVSRSQLASMNNLDPKVPLKEGQVLRYNNRRIIPEHRLKDGILINIPDRMLYLFEKGSLAFATAVALGTPTKTDQFVWETPTGRFRIVQKEKDPTWTVPPSIQEEMRLEGKEVITSIPPGPDNPLGKYAIKTSLPGILIHSTTKPWSIYSYASHGCIRVYPERMEALFQRVKTNTPGEIIYHPVKLAQTEDGRILLEAHGDIYKKTKGLTAEAQRLIHARRLNDKVDWEKVRRVLARKSGVAEDVTRSAEDSRDAAEAVRRHALPQQTAHSPS